MKLSSLQKGLVGHWTMAQDSLKGSLLADKTPYENDGTIYGATFTTDRKGKANSAMSFNGVNNYIDCGNGSSLNFKKEDSFTFSVWVKRTGTISGTTKVAGILMNGLGFLGHGIDYWQEGNKIRCGIRNSNETYTIEVTPSNNLLDWHYVVFSYEPSSLTGIKLYLNGIFKGSRSSVGITALTNTTLKIAKNNTLGGDANYFPGLIDDVRIYNRALSQEEITLLYNSYNPKIIL